MGTEYKSFFSMIGMRFARGFIAGFVTSLSMLTTSLDISTLLSNPRAYVYMIMSGAISGAVLAVDKYLRSDGTEYPH